MKSLEMVTRILVIVGGLNWGLVGIARFDLVATVFGAGSFLSNTVYALVGLSAVFQAYWMFAGQGSTLSAPAHDAL